MQPSNGSLALTNVAFIYAVSPLVFPNRQVNVNFHHLSRISYVIFNVVISFSALNVTCLDHFSLETTGNDPYS